jgi:hypothetical protein
METVIAGKRDRKSARAFYAALFDPQPKVMIFEIVPEFTANPLLLGNSSWSNR